MTETPKEQTDVGAGRAASEQDPTRNVSDERKAEIAEDTRPGSAIGGHKPGQTPAQERATMDDERQG